MLSYRQLKESGFDPQCTLQSKQHNNDPEPRAPLQWPHEEEEEEASTYLPRSCTEPSLSGRTSGLRVPCLNLGDATVGLVSARYVLARGHALARGPGPSKGPCHGQGPQYKPGAMFWPGVPVPARGPILLPPTHRLTQSTSATLLM